MSIMSPVNLKVVLLGKQNSGKTSLVERFIYNRFRGDLFYQTTIGAAFGAKKIEVDNEIVTLGVWDTAGTERYEAMCRMYYRDAGAAIICYDLTSDESFKKAKFWISELIKHEPDCRIYLCGTKCDLIQNEPAQRKVDNFLASNYVNSFNAVGVFETSSKDNIGVWELFTEIARDYAQNKIDRGCNGLEKLMIEENAIATTNYCC